MDGIYGQVCSTVALPAYLYLLSKSSNTTVGVVQVMAALPGNTGPVGKKVRSRNKE